MRVNPADLRDKTYLGDGVYAGHDGYQAWVWTENGYGPNNDAIALEPGVIDALNLWWARLTNGHAAEA